MRLAQARRPQRARVKSAHLPAPVGGINSIAPASGLPPLDCLFLRNMYASASGLAVRPGSEEHVTGLDGEVRSEISYTGSDGDGTKDRFFACTQTGIWNCTSSTDSPTQVVTFATQNAKSGYGYGTSFVTTAGHFLLYCDEANGYYVYTESTGTWAKIAQGAGASEINGANPASFAYVVAWKNRLIFVQADSATAWVLPVGQVYGDVTRFDFGNKFTYGGILVGLWTWTLDGGVGVDDYLVAISSAGDLLVYQGTDPADPDAFANRGAFFLGGVPFGRRIASTFGGDLFVLTQQGVILLSQIKGVENQGSYVSAKIQNLFTTLINQRRSSRGWEIKKHPAINAIVVNLPSIAGGEDQQLVMSLSTGGWSRWDGLPIRCAEAWRGQYYFGTADGRICIATGEVDGVTLDDDEPTAIDWSIVGRYDNLGSANIKRVQMIKPRFSTDGTTPTYTVNARYDYDLEEPALVSFSGSETAGTWGNSAWGSMLWGGGVGTAGEYRGSAGWGSAVAVELSGSSIAATTLIGFDAFWDEGGLL